MPRKPSPIEHGTYTTYTNRKCRCEECRNAAAEYMRTYRQTENGKISQKYHTSLTMKRAQLAARYVKNNHPKVWREINDEAVKLTKHELGDGSGNEPL